MKMAATLFRLTVDEIIPSVTREAARALGRLDQVGTLSAGKWCLCVGILSERLEFAL